MSNATLRPARTVNVRFSVNGGPERSSETLDFTCRNLALRSDRRVCAGDRVVARIGDMPPLEGLVRRVWAEGFTVALTPFSMEVAALSDDEAPPALVLDLDGVKSFANVRRFVSPYFILDAAEPAWCRIASTAPLGAGARHQVSVIMKAPIEMSMMRSVWLTVGDTRWIVRTISAGRRDAHSILVLRFNDWQMQMAAEFGLALSVVTRDFSEWQASASPEYLRAHLERLPARARA